MSDSLGLSIGMTNLVAARVGEAPVSRRAMLTLYQQYPPAVGLAGENPDHPTEPGLVLSGFVERVGDPVPLVAEDGSTHKAERVLVEALDVMANIAGSGQPATEVSIAVPAHWGPALLGALRGALRVKASLAPNGVPAALIPDSTAALDRTAGQSRPARRAGWWRCSISVAVAPASASLMPERDSSRSARPYGCPTSPANRSIRPF